MPGKRGKSGVQRGRVLPSTSPVDVPVTPKRPTRDMPDETARQSQPAADQREDANWADASAPRPRARKARTSIL